MGDWGGKYLNQTAFRAALGALLLAVVLCAGASAQIADNGPPLEGDAYTATETAYKAFGQGDYKASAASAAEGAIDTRMIEQFDRNTCSGIEHMFP